MNDLLGAAAPKVATLAMMVDEADREVRVRRQVYSRRVDQKKMTQAQADHRIWLMEQIRETLRGLKKP
jgi:hypothetical protein